MSSDVGAWLIFEAFCCDSFLEIAGSLHLDSVKGTRLEVTSIFKGCL